MTHSWRSWQRYDYGESLKNFISLLHESASKNLPPQRDMFEIPDGVTYLNCANLSPQLRAVSAAGLDSVALKKSPWKITPPDWFSGAETLRELAARVIGAGADEIALVPSVSYGIAVAAANVPVERGQSIVLLHEEYPSNLYAWKEFRDLFEASGFRLARVIPTQARVSVIEGERA